MSVSRAEQLAIKLRGIEREERRRKEIEDRETKLAHAAGMTWAKWKQRKANFRKVAIVKNAIEAAKRNPEIRAALLRELGCSCIDGQKALPAPESNKQ